MEAEESIRTVQPCDPMHDFLHRILVDQMEVRVTSPVFRARQLSSTSTALAYEEQGSKATLVAKFHWPKPGWNRDRAAANASLEFESLDILRGFDLIGSPHHVVQPFALDAELNCAIAMEYYKGESLSEALDRAMYLGDHRHLYRRLKALASFLAAQHTRTRSDESINFDWDLDYLDRVTATLVGLGRLGQWDLDEFSWLRDRWRERPDMWRDQQVWLHGDATPTNFLFGHRMDVAAIDLERMRRGDRMFDVGRVAAEIQHTFMLGTGHKHRAEPFIGHFLWEYSRHFPNRERTFREITARAPFYMGISMLRIARNDYLINEYTGLLVRQSKRLLRAC